MTDGNNMESPNSHRQPGNGETNGLPDTPESEQESNADGASAQVNTDHPSPPQPSTNADEEAPAPENKPTLTDHLNKSLLTSFLDRLNNPNMSSTFPEVQRIDTSDPEAALEIVDFTDTN